MWLSVPVWGPGSPGALAGGGCGLAAQRAVRAWGPGRPGRLGAWAARARLPSGQAGSGPGGTRGLAAERAWGPVGSAGLGPGAARARLPLSGPIGPVGSHGRSPALEVPAQRERRPLCENDRRPHPLNGRFRTRRGRPSQIGPLSGNAETLGGRRCSRDHRA